MKFHLTTAQGKQLITGYGAGWVEVNTQRFNKSLIILPDRLITDWQLPDFEQLTEQHFQQMADLAPEVVLLGTGEKIRFPSPGCMPC